MEELIKNRFFGEDHAHKGSTMDRQFPAPVGMDEIRVEY